jgi:hypothetical protein
MYNQLRTLQQFQNRIYFQVVIFSEEKISLDRHSMMVIVLQANGMEEVNQQMILLCQA